MANKPLPPQDVLRQLLDYDPETGVLTWKPRGMDLFPAKTEGRSRALCNLWNDRYAGTSAFTHVSDGYRIGALLGVSVRAHRVIWKWMTGEEPDTIDHISGVRANNAWLNLRDISVSENARNRRIQASNKSGILGVHRWSHNGFDYWVATSPRKKSRYFKCLGQAIKARKTAESEHGFHENHGRR